MGLDLILHHTIRLLMREGRMSADQAYDATVSMVLDMVAEITGGAEELVIWSTLLPELRRTIEARIETAIKCQRHEARVGIGAWFASYNNGCLYQAFDYKIPDQVYATTLGLTSGTT